MCYIGYEVFGIWFNSNNLTDLTLAQPDTAKNDRNVNVNGLTKIQVPLKYTVPQ